MTDRISPRQYAVRLAATAASRSEDPYEKVGACVLRHDNTVAALGYNGAPPGVEIDWSDRDARRPWVIHAEANALRYVKPGEVYLLASTMMPCEGCILLIASYGIKTVLFRDELTINYDTAQVLRIADECDITIDREAVTQ